MCLHTNWLYEEMPNKEIIKSTGPSTSFVAAHGEAPDVRPNLMVYPSTYEKPDYQCPELLAIQDRPNDITELDEKYINSICEAATAIHGRIMAPGIMHMTVPTPKMYLDAFIYLDVGVDPAVINDDDVRQALMKWIEHDSTDYKRLCKEIDEYLQEMTRRTVDQKREDERLELDRVLDLTTGKDPFANTTGVAQRLGYFEGVKVKVALNIMVFAQSVRGVFTLQHVLRYLPLILNSTAHIILLTDCQWNDSLSAEGLQEVRGQLKHPDVPRGQPRTLWILGDHAFILRDNNYGDKIEVNICPTITTDFVLTKFEVSYPWCLKNDKDEHVYSRKEALAMSNDNLENLEKKFRPIAHAGKSRIKLAILTEHKNCTGPTAADIRESDGEIKNTDFHCRHLRMIDECVNGQIDILYTVGHHICNAGPMSAESVSGNVMDSWHAELLTEYVSDYNLKASSKGVYRGYMDKLGLSIYSSRIRESTTGNLSQEEAMELIPTRWPSCLTVFHRNDTVWTMQERALGLMSIFLSAEHRERQRRSYIHCNRPNDRQFQSVNPQKEKDFETLIEWLRDDPTSQPTGKSKLKGTWTQHEIDDATEDQIKAYADHGYLPVDYHCWLNHTAMMDGLYKKAIGGQEILGELDGSTRPNEQSWQPPICLWMKPKAMENQRSRSQAGYDKHDDHNKTARFSTGKRQRPNASVGATSRTRQGSSSIPWGNYQSTRPYASSSQTPSSSSSSQQSRNDRSRSSNPAGQPVVLRPNPNSENNDQWYGRGGWSQHNY